VFNGIILLYFFPSTKNVIDIFNALYISLYNLVILLSALFINIASVPLPMVILLYSDPVTALNY